MLKGDITLKVLLFVTNLPPIVQPHQQ